MHALRAHAQPGDGYASKAYLIAFTYGLGGTAQPNGFAGAPGLKTHPEKKGFSNTVYDNTISDQYGENSLRQRGTTLKLHAEMSAISKVIPGHW